MAEIPGFEFNPATVDRQPPGITHRLFAVWKRHQQVYFKSLLANGLPPFMEPVFFLLALGLGLGKEIGDSFGGVPYAEWMAPGLLAMSAMYTASFETTYGTLFRMQYGHVYDALISTPATIKEVFWGEILWCGTKGAMFCSCIIFVFLFFGIGTTPLSILTIPLGFLVGMMFAGLGMTITSRVKQFNTFNFYITGFLTPMVYFSGLFFPVSELPAGLDTVAWCLPLAHVIELMRWCLSGGAEAAIPNNTLLSIGYLIVFPLIVCNLGVRLLSRRVIT